MTDEQTAQLKDECARIRAERPALTKIDILRLAAERFDFSRTMQISTGAATRYVGRDPKPPKEGVLDRIRAAEQEINKALHDIDEERDSLMQRIRDLDNLAAKYKSFRNGQ